MSFDEKFALCISNIANVSKPDYPRLDVNYYADFIELLVLISGGEGVSYGDIQDRFYGETGGECVDEYGENPESETAEEKIVSQTNDSQEAFIDCIFNVIKERVHMYGDLYPFELLLSDEFGLKSDLSVDHKKYIFLLLSSALDIFKPFNHELTTDFEKLCYDVLKEFLPTGEIKAFGKNSDYTGTAKEKIRKLAEDIGLAINEKEWQEIDNGNVQERGLDVAGWLPFEDKCPNLMLFLGQCACGKNYEYKQHELKRFKRYIDFPQTKPQCTLFVPYSLVNPQTKDFYRCDLIEEEILVFERKRILDRLKGKDEAYANLEMRSLIDRLLLYSPYGEVEEVQ